MFFFFKIIFLIFEIKKINLSKIPITERKYKWQVHSFNDIREINQIARKGTIYYKIDLYYVLQKNCYTKDKRCTSDKRGCFLLTHDTPIQGKIYYNIYDYMKEILQNEKYFKNRKIKFNIALCFKNTPNDICTEDKNEWVNLVNDLYNYIMTTIKENNLDIEIIYDGDKKECIRKYWPLWNYTWIRGRDPDDAFYSNDKDKYYYKFSVFNDKYTFLKNDSLLNYGKFINESRPLQIWEPNHQNLINYCQEIFESVPHKFGYSFAINMDTSMYQVYTGNISLENINQNIIDNYEFFMNNSVFEIIDNEICLFNNYYKSLKFFILNNNNTMSLDKEIVLENISNGILKDVLIINKNNDIYTLILYNEKGDFCQYYLNIKNKIIEKYFCKNFNEEMIPVNTSKIFQLISISLINDKYKFIAYVSNENKNVIIIRPLYFLFEKAFPFFIKKIVTYDEIENLDFKCISNKCLLIYKINGSSYLKSYIIKVDLKHFIIEGYKFKNFGVGNHFSISVFKNKKDNKDKFFIVKDGSYCYHTEKNNKNANIFLCDRIEYSMEHVLNYIYGNLDLNDLNDNKNNDYSNICNKKSLTGTYDLGDNPKIKIFYENDEMNFIEMHDALRFNTSKISCGMPNFHNGIIADNWNIGDINL